jgi:hypothetical protein
MQGGFLRRAEADDDAAASGAYCRCRGRRRKTDRNTRIDVHRAFVSANNVAGSDGGLDSIAFVGDGADAAPLAADAAATPGNQAGGHESVGLVGLDDADAALISVFACASVAAAAVEEDAAEDAARDAYAARRARQRAVSCETLDCTNSCPRARY